MYQDYIRQEDAELRLHVFTDDEERASQTISRMMRRAYTVEDRMASMERVGCDNSDTGTEPDDEKDFEPEELFLARSHWIQLAKVNMQGTLVQLALLELLKQHKHLRPMFRFGRVVDTRKTDWERRVFDNFHFRHHCASVQAALTLCMDNLDDLRGLRRLLRQLGAHHFFYDAFEAHVELFVDIFLATLKEQLQGTKEALDDATQISWHVLMHRIKRFMSDGMTRQRTLYLKHCIGNEEMTKLRSNWQEISAFGVQKAGAIVCESALTTYTKLLVDYRLEMPLSVEVDEQTFRQFSALTMQALGDSLEAYSEEEGFVHLVDRLRDFVLRCLLIDVCPTLVRKAVMEGIVTMLTDVVGPDAVRDEHTLHCWSKLYRVLEQCVIINILNY